MIAKAPPTVQEFYDSTFKPERCKTLAKQTTFQYEVSIKRLCLFLGRPALLTDLSVNTLTAWQQTATEYGLAAATVRHRRHYLQAIAKFAIERGALPADFVVLTKQRGPKPKDERPQPLPADVGPGMFLAPDFVALYVTKRNAERPIGRDLSQRSREHLAECASAFSLSIGRPARVVDLTAERINSYLGKMIADGLSPWTVKSRRTGLMVLLRRAIRMRLVNNVDPHDVRSVFCPQLANNGFSQADAERLIAASLLLVGVIHRTAIPRSVYFESAIRLLWDTGIRSGDIMRLSKEDFDPAGRIWVIENKTGKRGSRAIRSSTCEAIARCIAVGDQSRKTIWAGICARNFWRGFKALAASAGMAGTSKWMRRGSSSEIDKRQPGSGWRFLNHSTPTLFEDHYRVDRIAQPKALMPPELFGDEKGGLA